MKRFLFIFLALFPFLCQAQDILIKRNGDEQQVKVQEIGLNEVKYKRFDNLEGPVISIAKADVFMIKYENGTKEVFTSEAPRTGTTPAQRPAAGIPAQESLRLSGPRIGFTILSQRTIDKIKENHYDPEWDLNPFITQFGWQFETRIFTLDNGVSGLFEFVPLVGGLEQGKFLPSLNALVGVRGTKGFEFGLGPTVSLAGAGLVLAVGTNFQSQGVNFPVNFAVAPTQHGTRVSLLLGFNSRKY